jgi:hypothetical protein
LTVFVVPPSATAAAPTMTTTTAAPHKRAKSVSRLPVRVSSTVHARQ